MVNSIYIHIPFCSNICNYCDFCKFYYDQNIADKYIEQLLKEINANYKGEVINTIYIGGGTPSCLSIPQLEKLLSFFNIINVSDSFEYTIECNIMDITKEKMELFKKYHVNRVSIGVESFQESVLTYLGRFISKDKIIEKINLVKEYFDNINVDLIYAVPGEDIKILKKDLELFISLDIPHISTYSLIIEEHTKLGINNTKNIDEEMDSNMYDLINDTLVKNNYIHYEISNFCRDGFESKHNLTYWKNNKYYGFGLGASGYIDNFRYTNTRNINKYLSGDYIDNKDVLSREIDASNYAILALRTRYGIDKKKFNQLYGCDFILYFDVADLLDDGILIDNGDSYSIDYKYWYVSNEILTRFI